MASTKPNIQIDDEIREMTDAEHTAYKAQQTASVASEAEAQAEADAKVATRQSALAKLSALGLTLQEVASL